MRTRGMSYLVAAMSLIACWSVNASAGEEQCPSPATYVKTQGPGCCAVLPSLNCSYLIIQLITECPEGVCPMDRACGGTFFLNNEFVFFFRQTATEPALGVVV